jgi:hypothetical protein
LATLPILPRFSALPPNAAFAAVRTKEKRDENRERAANARPARLPDLSKGQTNENERRDATPQTAVDAKG